MVPSALQASRAAAPAGDASRAASASPRTAESFAIVALAVGLLLARPLASSLPTGMATGAVAIVFAAILVASVSVPVRRSPRMLPASIVAAAGLAAVAISVPISGPAPPMPVGPLAVPMVVLAAVSEEALFRRLLYWRLEPYGAAVAIGASALAFALMHIPAYGISALPVDLGAGILLSWQRWASGSWSAPAATHAAANLVAVLR